MNHLIRAFKVVVVLGIAMFVGLAVAVAAAVVGHQILVLRYGEDLTSIDDTPPMFLTVSATYLAGLVAGLVALVVGWRQLVTNGSPGFSRRLAYVIGWSLVGWFVAIVAGNVLYGSANALAYLIAVGFGVAAYLVLLFRDRHRAVTPPPHR